MFAYLSTWYLKNRCWLLLHCASKKFLPFNSLQLCLILTDFQNFALLESVRNLLHNPYDITHLALGMWRPFALTQARSRSPHSLMASSMTVCGMLSRVSMRRRLRSAVSKKIAMPSYAWIYEIFWPFWYNTGVWQTGTQTDTMTANARAGIASRR